MHAIRGRPSARLAVLTILVIAAGVIIGLLVAPGGGQHQAGPDPAASPISTVLVASEKPDLLPPCRGVRLTPGRNVQAAIDRARPGTTFCFGRGTYVVSSLMPKSGDVLDGDNRAAVLDGEHSAYFAIYGDQDSPGPSDVTVRGFVIRNYATPLQRGAIQDYNGSGWTIEDNDITNNAAAGVATGNDVRVLDNLLEHNRQEGFSASGNGGLYQGNEIAYNNSSLAVNPGWEAGGGKAHATRHLTFKSNYVYDNGGNGLWADTNNIYTTYEDNTVSDNWGAGIYEEISYNATIVDNIVTGNGMPSSPGGGNRQGWAWDGGITLRETGSISASEPLVISGNIVADNYNGISLVQSPASGCAGLQGAGLYGPCNIKNVLVENNWITMTQGATGAYQDGAGDGIFKAQNNVFRGNHYCVSSAAHPNDGYAYGWFAWLNNWVTLTLQPGQTVPVAEAGGTFQIGSGCGPHNK